MENILKLTTLFQEDNHIVRLNARDETFYIGWNYGLSSNSLKCTNQNLVAMMCTLQMYYYKIRFYKLYFKKKMKKLLNNPYVSSEELKQLSNMNMSFQNMRLDYTTLKSSFIPKIHIEFCKVEQRWNMEEDLELIGDMIKIQNEYTTKQYQLSIEKINQSMNYALSFIAVLQIASIYGLLKSYLEVELNFSSYLVYANSSILFIVVSLILIIMFSHKK